VDVAPRGTLVVLRNPDVPGVIGRVGTLVGESGVKIAEYHQARLQVWAARRSPPSPWTARSPRRCRRG
jgi:hypothetical protein